MLLRYRVLEPPPDRPGNRGVKLEVSPHGKDCYLQFFNLYFRQTLINENIFLYSCFWSFGFEENLRSKY